LLSFFQSQQNDPKPLIHNSIPIIMENGNELGANNSDRSIDEDEDLYDNDLNNSSGQQNDDPNEDDDDDGDDDDDDDDDYNYESGSEDESDMNSYFTKRSSHMLTASLCGLNGISSNLNNNNNRHSIALSLSGRSCKVKEKEAALWWDEDEALNELTTSMSFDFLNSNNNSDLNNNNNKNSNDGDDIETLKTLEKILKSSELFGHNHNNNSQHISTPTPNHHSLFLEES
jgi:hypothetical protein